jgi:hypothetical protein
VRISHQRRSRAKNMSRIRRASRYNIDNGGTVHSLAVWQGHAPINGSLTLSEQCIRVSRRVRRHAINTIGARRRRVGGCLHFRASLGTRARRCASGDSARSLIQNDAKIKKSSRQKSVHGDFQDVATLISRSSSTTVGSEKPIHSYFWLISIVFIVLEQCMRQLAALVAINQISPPGEKTQG